MYNPTTYDLGVYDGVSDNYSVSVQVTNDTNPSCGVGISKLSQNLPFSIPTLNNS